MQNDDLCTVLLYWGRRNLKLSSTLSKWIPQIRQFPTKITLEDNLSWLPEWIQLLVKQALGELTQNDVSKYEPMQNSIDPEFRRLVLTLPIPIRLRIFGYSLRCYMCQKRMCTIDSKLTDVKWLLFKDKPLCSKRCLKSYATRGNVGISTLVDCLVSAAGIIDMDDSSGVRLAVLR